MQLAAPLKQRTDTTGNGLEVRVAVPDALDLLKRFGTTVTVQRDREIYGQDEPAEFCWRIIFGCARTMKLLEDGRRQVGDFLWAGDFLGLDDLDRHDLAAEAVTHMTLRRYPRRTVEALAQSHAALAVRIRTLSMANLERTRQQIILLGRKTAMERIATFVLEMHRHSTAPNGRIANVPMSRADIADYLGLTIETVCRTLALLRREGVSTLWKTALSCSIGLPF